LEEFLGKKIDCIFPEESMLIPIPEMYRKIVPQKFRKREPFKKKNTVPRRRN
jgi:hypothetical protein